MKKANILFVNMPSIPYKEVEAYLTGKSTSSTQLHGEPLGLLYISSYLKKYGNPNQVAVLDYQLNLISAAEYANCEDFIVKVAERDVKFQPDIIGFSINFTCTHRFLMKTAEILKGMYPNAITIVGGFHATNATKDLLESPFIDYVSRGESEISFTKFVDYYNQGLLESKPVQGIYGKELLKPVKPGDLPIMMTNGESAEDLDVLPPPDRSIIDMNQYASEQGRTTILSKKFEKRKASIITNRGCYFKCSFCASRTVFSRKMRFRSTANVIDEMKALYRDFKINFFVIEDDLFTGNKQKCLDFLAETRKLDIEGLEIQFPNDLNINTTNEEIFDAMIGAGLKVAHLAVESGDPYVQKEIITKNVKLEKVKPHVEYLQSKGVVVKCIYIIGFPGETVELMQSTIDFARGVGADWSLFNIATPLLGTPMADQFLEKGYIKRDIEMLANIDFKYRSFDTNEISAKDLNALQYRANLDINFINNRNFINGKYELAINIYEEIVKKYPFHIIALACIRKCHDKMGNKVAYDSVTKMIAKALETDQKARDMLDQYGDMMPELQEFGARAKSDAKPVVPSNVVGIRQPEASDWAKDPRTRHHLQTK